MNFNYTLIGQLLAFILFVWFCMRFIWPQLLDILETREKEISDGLEAASRGERALEEAESKKTEVMGLAKKEAAELISQANLRANQMVEDAKSKAQEEADRIKESAEKDVVQSMNKAREGLRSEVAVLAVAGAEKLLKAEIDQEANATLIDEIASEL
jgi:F-type H+-transporting ATPase subunit b